MAKGTCSEETLRASSKQDEANSGRGLVVVRVGIAAAADSSVNRCLESDGAWHHITAPAHPPPPRIACRVKRVLIDCRRGGPPSRNRHTLSQPVLCSRLAATDTPAQDFLTSTPLTLPHTSLVCAFAGAGPLAISLSLRVLLFRIRLFVPAYHYTSRHSENAQEEGRQGTRPGQAEGQGTECICCAW
jgi:hypothetical protein